MTTVPSGIWPIDPNVTTGTDLANYLNTWMNAFQSMQASPTRPPLITKGGVWAKTIGAADIALMFYDGTADHAIGSVVGGSVSFGGVGASTAPPTSPSTGDTWVDTTIAGAPIFKVYNGTSWVAAGGGSPSGTAAPTVPAPVAGDLWVDTATAGAPVLKVYNGTTWVVANASSPSGTTAPTVPAPVAGDLWVDTTTVGAPVLKVYNGTSWVEAGNGAATGTAAPTVPAPASGDLWVDTTTAGAPVLKVYNGTTWIAAGGGVPSGATAPTIPAPVEGDAWVDTSSAGKPAMKVYNGTKWDSVGGGGGGIVGGSVKAWVNFDGTGATAIRAGGNVSSIRDDGVGRYAPRFSAPLIDLSFCTIVSVAAVDANRTANVDANSSLGFGNKTLNEVSVITGVGQPANLEDAADVNVVVIR